MEQFSVSVFNLQNIFSPDNFICSGHNYNFSLGGLDKSFIDILFGGKMAVQKVNLISTSKYVDPTSVEVHSSTRDTILFKASSTNSFNVVIPDAGQYFEDVDGDLVINLAPSGLAETPPLKTGLSDVDVVYKVYKIVDSAGRVVASDAPPKIIIRTT